MISKTPEFKRPNHADFKDSFELKKENFSGIRRNSLTREWEIWVEGEVRGHGPEADIDAFAYAYQEIFACNNVAIVDKGE
jgi:hypothetical protein